MTSYDDGIRFDDTLLERQMEANAGLVFLDHLSNFENDYQSLKPLAKSHVSLAHLPADWDDYEITVDCD